MNTILVLSAHSMYAQVVADWVSQLLNCPFESLYNLKLKETSKSPREWEYLDHYELSQKVFSKLGKVTQVIHSSVVGHPMSKEDPIVPFITYPPKPADVIIAIEVPLDIFTSVHGIPEDQAKLILYNEREWTVRIAEANNIPLIHITGTEPRSVIEGKIKAFLNSLNEETPTILIEPIEGQEIQCSVYESAPEVQEEMRTWLIERGVDKNRLAYSWDTWIGIFFHPPMDELRWEPSEFQQIYKLLKEHPNVMRVDIPEQGRLGMARSTG